MSNNRSQSKLDAQSHLSNTNVSSIDDKPDYYKVRAEREVKSSFDDKVGDLKTQQESRLTQMRDDIQRKEREIYDLKNQINLVNLRISKEAEAKDAAEHNLQKNNDNFSHDASKFNQSVQTAERDNQAMKAKLQDMQNQVTDMNNAKTQISSKLDNTSQGLEEAQRHFTLESDEQNRVIAVLHQELKDLQDKMTSNNHKSNHLGNKVKELTNTQNRVESEQSESILRLKSEHERLKQDNHELHGKVSRLQKDVEQSKDDLEKSTYEKMQSRNNADQDLNNLGERLKEANHLNHQLDVEHKNAMKTSYDQEVRIKEERNELEHRIREASFQLDRAATEQQSLYSKLDDTESRQRKVQSDNEQLLLQFEENKQENNNNNIRKDNEIESLRNEQYDLENKLKYAADVTLKLENNINETNRRQTEMKDGLNADINSVSKKHSLLKSKQDDVILELRHRLEQLKTVQVKSDELSNRFDYTAHGYSTEINKVKDDNHKKQSNIEQLKRDQDNLNKDCKIVRENCSKLDSDLAELTRRHEWAVSDLANTMRRLEETNYNLESEKEILTRSLGVKSSEAHNLYLALTETRNHAVRRETDYNSNIKTGEFNINTDKESMRGLIALNQELTKSQDDMIRQKESQHNEIKEVRTHILEIERRLRDAHESFITRDVNDILALTDQHTNTRSSHMNHVRDTIEQLRDNLHRISNLEDLKNIEQNLGQYKRSLEDGEKEISTRDIKLNEYGSMNQSLRREVDQHNRAKADNEAENKKIADTRTMQDGLWMDNHRINDENQTLQTHQVKSQAELREAYERRNAYIESSPHRRFNQEVKPSSGVRNQSSAKKIDQETQRNERHSSPSRFNLNRFVNKF